MSAVLLVRAVDDPADAVAVVAGQFGDLGDRHPGRERVAHRLDELGLRGLGGLPGGLAFPEGGVETRTHFPRVHHTTVTCT